MSGRKGMRKKASRHEASRHRVGRRRCCWSRRRTREDGTRETDGRRWARWTPTPLPPPSGRGSCGRRGGAGHPGRSGRGLRPPRSGRPPGPRERRTVVAARRRSTWLSEVLAISLRRAIISRCWDSRCWAVWMSIQGLMSSRWAHRVRAKRVVGAFSMGFWVRESKRSLSVATSYRRVRRASSRGERVVASATMRGTYGTAPGIQGGWRE